MLSLIRKISSARQSTETLRKKDDNEVNADNTNREEEVDGTTYDPDADPRDPERYYTFPHFAEEKQETSSHTDDENQVNDERTPILPQTPKSKPKTTPWNTEPASPPFWPISPIPKRLHNSNPSIPAAPKMQRRATTNLTPSQPLPIRERPARRASAQVLERAKEVHSPTREQKQQRKVSAYDKKPSKRDGERRVTGN
ncbi:hypothetical protein D6D01_08915 [Aureobasidium pullulans]|uniref:Uncharacterized protein n=1 Tax=Aureobasidium pullulans TaxID=5580 RepID=A0A4S9K6Z5_AURPU|nr:hypothetical protein D6D01_08915 [Aureobasidium pullulans]